MKVYDTSLIINGIIFIKSNIYSIIKLFVNNLVAMCDQVKSIDFMDTCTCVHSNSAA